MLKLPCGWAGCAIYIVHARRIFAGIGENAAMRRLAENRAGMKKEIMVQDYGRKAIKPDFSHGAAGKRAILKPDPIPSPSRLVQANNR